MLLLQQVDEIRRRADAKQAFDRVEDDIEFALRHKQFRTWRELLNLARTNARHRECGRAHACDKGAERCEVTRRFTTLRTIRTLRTLPHSSAPFRTLRTLVLWAPHSAFLDGVVEQGP